MNILPRRQAVSSGSFRPRQTCMGHRVSKGMEGRPLIGNLFVKNPGEWQSRGSGLSGPSPILWDGRKRRQGSMLFVFDASSARIATVTRYGESVVVTETRVRIMGGHG
jgi:hypothetical protein